MAGILANSVDVTMVSGDETPDNQVGGFVDDNLITLTVVPSGTSYAWTLSRPSGATIRSALSATTAAETTFIPDAEGTYLITLVVDGTTTYNLRATVVAVLTGNSNETVRFFGIPSASVPTPLTDAVHLFHQEQTDTLSIKRDDGTVVEVGEGSGGGGAGAPTQADKRLVASVTVADGDQATASTLSEKPISGSPIQFIVSNLVYYPGDGVKTTECYFSNDGGATARAWDDIDVGDTAHWNGSVAQYELSADDLIELGYTSTLFGDAAGSALLPATGGLTSGVYFSTLTDLTIASGVVNIDFVALTGPAMRLILTENVTSITVSNIPVSSVFSLTLFVEQDGIGGRTIAASAWPSVFGNVTPPVIQTGINAKSDVINLITRDAGSRFDASGGVHNIPWA